MSTPCHLENSLSLSNPDFCYEEAFSRNLGWLTASEQQKLRNSRVAFAGLGGVGGIYLLTLARLGVERFTVADFDTFSLANMNRQAGATLASLEQPKIDVMEKLAREINPALDIRRFPEGVTVDNTESFLEGADVYLDGLDFFALAIRRHVFARCAARGIPAVTVAPLGFGAALLNFVPGGMNFEQYFQLEGHAPADQALRFLVGLSPAMLQIGYLADPSRVKLEEQAGPSSVIGVQLCSGVAAMQAVKLILGRGEIVAAPWGLHFDGYRNKLKRTWRPGGNRHPLQRLILRIAKRRLAAPRTMGG